MTIGFVGFGEVGSTIAGGLRSAGCERPVAYDIDRHDASRGPLIERRAAESGTTLVDSSAELAHRSRIIFSTVTSNAALDAAMQTAPFLTPEHVYADLNSVSPALKQQVGTVVDATGARFVEVAVMAPVAPHGHRVPMLLGGPAASAFAEMLAPFGMRLEVLGVSGIGAAAAVKMCRSIVVKGLEALICECVLGASRYGADEHVFESLNESFPGLDWKNLADYMVGRVVVHGERRAREMEEVADTLRAVGVDPIMAEATVRRQDWVAQLGLRSHFGPKGPRSYREVLEILATDPTRGA
jgi:3-hydroxyisobutyrate dehydrogenase-like beta-hydroxyacid dehydrogenase